MWIIYALIATVGYSSNHIVNKFILEKLNTWNTVFITSFFVSLIIFVFSILYWVDWVMPSFYEWIFLIFSSVIGFIALWGLFKSFENISIGESISIANAFPFVMLILMFVFYQELINIFQFFAMLIVFVWIVLIAIQDQNFRFSKKTLYAFITLVGWWIYNFSMDFFVRQWFEILQIAFMFEFGIFISSLLYVVFTNQVNKDFCLFLKNNLKIVWLGFLSWISTAIWTFFTVLAMSYISAAIVWSVVSSQVVFSTILGYLVLNEKISIKKIVGILIVFVGLFIYNFV